MSEPLRVFMPVVHRERAAAFAASLRLSGGVMIINDATATQGPRTDARFTPERAREFFGDNVELYSGEDILARPPDVVVAGRVDHEAATCELWRRLNAIRPVVLCAYSGVFQSRFTFPLYHGVISEDLASRVVARHHDVPALKFLPYFDFAAHPYVPEPPQDRVILRSYILQFERRFPFAHAFHEECRSTLRAQFGDRVVVENIEGVPPQRVRECMVESSATLHIKDNEGFGWSMVQSLAAGRPVISQAGLSRNMTYREWIAEDAQDLLIDRPGDLVPLVSRLFEDKAWRAALQANAADTIRRRYDSAAHAASLHDFLNALVTIQHHRWRAWGGDPSTRPVGAYRPTLDRDELQDFEKAILGGRPASDFTDL